MSAVRTPYALHVQRRRPPRERDRGREGRQLRRGGAAQRPLVGRVRGRLGQGGSQFGRYDQIGLAKARWRPGSGPSVHRHDHRLQLGVHRYDCDRGQPSAPPRCSNQQYSARLYLFTTRYAAGRFQRQGLPQRHRARAKAKTAVFIPPGTPGFPPRSEYSGWCDQDFNVETMGSDVHNTSRFNFGDSKLALTYGGDVFRDEVNDNDPFEGGDDFTPSGERTVGGAFVQSHADLLRHDRSDRGAALRHLRSERHRCHGWRHARPRSERRTGLAEDHGGVYPGEGDDAVWHLRRGLPCAGRDGDADQRASIPPRGPVPVSAQSQPAPGGRAQPRSRHQPQVRRRLQDATMRSAAGSWPSRTRSTTSSTDLRSYGPCTGRHRSSTRTSPQATLEGIEIEAMYDARAWFAGRGCASHPRHQRGDRRGPLLGSCRSRHADGRLPRLRPAG